MTISFFAESGCNAAAMRYNTVIQTTEVLENGARKNAHGL